MDIEKRLKDDAARIAGIQPPADLRRRLHASLEGTPVYTGPSSRRWFKPAMAVLTAAMLAVAFLPGRSPTPVLDILSGADASPEAALTETKDLRGEDDNGILVKKDTFDEGDERVINEETDLSAPPGNLPWGRVGAFSGLAVLTGALWFFEFGRRRQLALALIIPVLTLILGNVWLLRNLLF